MTEPRTEDPFITKLLEYSARKDRAALAALRTGVGKAPGEAVRMFPYLAGYMPAGGPSAAKVRTTFLIAALFASHPQHTKGQSLGMALWHATKRDRNPNGKHGEAGVSARFAKAIDAHPEDLARHVEALVALLASASEGLDWYLLASDIRGLLSENEDWRNNIRIQWARDFYQGPPNKSETPQEGTPT